MSILNKEKKENGAMIKVATFIVDKRNLFFLLFVLNYLFHHLMIFLSTTYIL